MSEPKELCPCPKCGAMQHTLTVEPVWACGSRHIAGTYWQSERCRIRELETQLAAARLAEWEVAREACKNIALAIDSCRGNEKEIANAIASLTPPAAKEGI